LGNWVDTQRSAFKNGRMYFERKAKLDEIAFEFSVRDKADEETWNLHFKKLQEYNGKHGHCELFWAVDRVLPSSLNTILIILPVL
jgi:hypothetical protein